MTQEEKAKRYDERLAKARKEYSIHEANNAIGIMDALERVFPELKESEDEGIKEWLINLVKGHIEWLKDRIREQLSNGHVYGDELVKAKNSLAWLGKQGEQKSANNDIKEALHTEYEKGRADAIAEMQKSAWSEEDETMVEDIIEAIDTQYAVTDYNEMVNWLKSLKERYTWKPSDEQIKVCKEVYVDLLATKGFDLGTVNSELNRLEEKLKKLREE